MSALKDILEQRGMPCCGGCGMRMRMMQGTCPGCGAGFGLGMGAKDAPGMAEGAETTDVKSDVDTSEASTSKIGKKAKASKIVFSTGEDDSTKRVQEDIDTAEYTIKKYVDQYGETKTRKIRPHRIEFKNSRAGAAPAQQTDSTKKVQENMKTTYKDMMTAYSAMRVESLQLEDEINEVLSKDAAAGEWISDFVHSDNPKFAGKSKEKRKQMALAAYYAKQRNEEVDKAAYRKRAFAQDSNGLSIATNNKAVYHLGHNAEKEHMSHNDNPYKKGTSSHHHWAKGLEHAYSGLPPSFSEEVELGEGEVPAHMKGKQKPYVSTIGMDHEVLGNTGQVKATFTRKEHGKEAKAKAIAHLKQNYDAYMKEEVEEIDEATVGQIAQAHGFQKQTSGASKGSYKHPKTGETITALRDQTFGHSTNDGGTIASFKHKNSLEKHLADKGYKKAVSEEVEEIDEAEYKISTAQMGHAGKTTIKHIKNPDVTQRMAAHDVKSYADRIALLKDAKRKGNLKEDDMQESVFDWKKNPKETSDKTKTSTYHDVKKVSTGTVYTKQFDKDGTSKGTGGDAAAKAENAPKRGRGRPKKDKFAESVEILMSLSEDQFDSMMEDGFDTFFEAFEQLDEASKAALKSCGKSTK